MNMNLNIAWIFLLTVSGAQCLNKTTFANVVIEDFQNEEDWTNLNETCRQRMLEIFNGAKNFTLWATWVLDSLQMTPQGFFYDVPHQMSNYDQCTFTPWTETHPELEMKYRTVTVYLNKERKLDEHVEALEPYGSASKYFTRRHYTKNFKEQFFWSLCVPPSCDLADTEKIAEILLSRSHLAHRLDNTKIVGVECTNGTESIHSNRHLPWIAAMLIITAILGSTYIYKTKMFSEDKRVMGIAKSLSIIENWIELTNTDPKELDALNGIKCMSSFLVISIHNLLINILFGLSNSLTFTEMLTKPPYLIALSTFMIVDSFFAMSGLFFAKQMLDKMNDPENPLKTMFKRYMRLAPLAMSAVIIQVNSMTNPASAPNSCVVQDNLKVCKSWWLEATLLPRYFGVQDLCQFSLWSTFIDFELTVIMTIILTIYRKNKKLGISAIFLYLIFGVTKTAHLVISSNAPIIEYVRPETRMVDIKHNPFLFLYYSTEGRIASYLIGVAAGFLIHFYKPRNYRKYFSKTLSTIMILMNCIIVTLNLYWVSSASLQVFAVPDMFLSVLVNSTHKGIFSFCTVFFIGTCLYGDVPFLISFLSSKVFMVLGRLTYAVYIVHVPLIYSTVSHNRGPFYVDPVKFVVDIVGFTVLSYILAVGAFLLIEAPARNLTNYLLFNKKQKKTNTVTKSNLNQNGKELIENDKTK